MSSSWDDKQGDRYVPNASSHGKLAKLVIDLLRGASIRVVSGAYSGLT